METYAFYNGRERGFTLHVTHPDRLFRANLYISFAEHKSSDDVVVYSWTADHKYNNPPVPGDLTEAGAWGRASYCKSVDEAVRHIRELMGRFLVEEEKRTSAVEEVMRS